jgi:hypothetical protein
MPKNVKGSLFNGDFNALKWGKKALKFNGFQALKE